MTIKVVDGEDDGKVTLSAREPQDGSSVLATLDDPDGGETAVEWQWYRGGDDEDTADTLARWSMMRRRKIRTTYVATTQ